MPFESCLSIKDANGRHISLLNEPSKQSLLRAHLQEFSPNTSTMEKLSTVTSNRRRYPCPEPTCDKSFTTSGHLARHNRIHTGEKNFQCLYPGCLSRFSRQDNMMQHYRTHTSPKSRRYFHQRCHHQFINQPYHKMDTPLLHCHSRICSDNSYKARSLDMQHDNERSYGPAPVNTIGHYPIIPHDPHGRRNTISNVHLFQEPYFSVPPPCAPPASYAYPYEADADPPNYSSYLPKIQSLEPSRDKLPSIITSSLPHSRSMSSNSSTPTSFSFSPSPLSPIHSLPLPLLTPYQQAETSFEESSDCLPLKPLGYPPFIKNEAQVYPYFDTYYPINYTVSSFA